MEELVFKYQKSLMAFVRRKIGDEDVVEELTQDILMAAYQALPAFNKKSSEFSLSVELPNIKLPITIERKN